MRKKLIIISIIFLGSVSVVYAAPYFRYERSLLPVDSTENIGTSTARWAEGWFNNINVSGTCTGCGSGSGSGNVATSTEETSGYVSFWTSNSATPATLGADLDGTFTYDSASEVLDVTTINAVTAILDTFLSVGAVTTLTGTAMVTSTYNYPTSSNANEIFYGVGSTIGSTANFVYNGTNMGIGTSSPYATLSVVGEVVARNFTATSTAATSTFSGGLTIGSTSPSSLSVDRFTGRVGIRTNTPVTNFDVRGGASVGGTGANGTNIVTGIDAFGTGSGVNASGDYSFAQGETTDATGYSSSSFGTDTTASGNFSMSEGIATIASGIAGHAGGENTTAGPGSRTFAWGYFSDATANDSVVIGTSLVSSAANAYSFGTGFTNSTASTFSVGFGTALFNVGANNVGIGTTSPQWKLQVSSTSAAELVLTDTGASTNKKHLLLSYNDGLFRVGTTSDTAFNSTSTAITINPEGSAQLLVATSSNASAVLATNGRVFMAGITSATGGNAVCIDASNELENAGNLTCALSSIRFKDNVMALSEPEAIGIIKKLEPVSFDWKNVSPEDSPQSLSFIAEDVAKVDVRLVDYGYDGKPIGLMPNSFLAVIVKTLQYILAKITGLDDRLNEQDARINALEKLYGL